MKSVQIPQSLFVELIEFFNQEPEDIRDGFKAQCIKQDLNTKLDKMISHILYSEYKRAATPEEKKKALNKYLENKREIF